MQVNIRFQEQFKTVFDDQYREIAIYSGRGTGKSYFAADYFILKALSSKCKILCIREIQKTIDDSILSLLAIRISHHNLDDYFDVQKTTINCINGSKFLFRGLKDTTSSGIKSLADVSSVLIDEAQDITKRSLDILLPTIFRNKNAQIMYCYNPNKDGDAVYQRFNKENTPNKSLVLKVCWRKNKYFEEAMLEEMAFNYKHDPENAEHIWEGSLCPSPNGMAVIPLSWLRKCVDAHKSLNMDVSNEWGYMGFDVADTGKDSCAIAYRVSSILKDVKEFNSEFISQSVDVVHNYTLGKKIARVHYDASGLGAGAKSDFNRLSTVYLAEAFIGGSKPKGYDKIYLDKITNSQYFRNLKAQSWWNIRIRVENTLRLLDGEDINPHKCFFIDSNIDNLDKIVLELSQASYKHEDSKLMVNKQPNNESSPNLADSIVQSFVQDIKNGLKAK